MPTACLKQNPGSRLETGVVCHPTLLTGAWLALAVVTLALYACVWNYDFITLDDGFYITDNPPVLAGLTWDSVRWAFTTDHAGYWQPLTWLSFMLDVQWFGRGAGGMHATNVALHVVNVVLLFRLLRRLTGATWRSLLVAALFALHPLRVESVAWVTERKDVLSTFFGLLSLLCYARYAQEPKHSTSNIQHPKTNVRGWYWLALVAFALGLMCKPMLVTWPFVLLLLDFWPLNRFQFSAFRFQLLKEKLPFFLLSGIFSLVTVWAQNQAGAMSGLTQLPLVVRVANAGMAYVDYLGKTFWPVKLAVLYPYAKVGTWLSAGLALALIAGLSVAAWVWGRRRGWLLVGWFWFLGTLVPVIGLLQSGQQALADRFTYVPLVGLFVLLAWGLGEIAGRWPRAKSILLAATGVVLAALALRTADQLRHWRNSETLYRHTLAVTRDNATMYHNLALCLSGQGRDEEALALGLRALRILPTDPGTLNNLGVLMTRRGELASAEEQYRRALQFRPDYVEAWCNLGVCLAQQGKPAAAVEAFSQALKFKPDDVRTLSNLGKAHLDQGRVEDALVVTRRALQLQPDNVEALNNLGLILAGQGNTAEAIRQYQQALRIDPGFVRARNNLANAWYRQGNNGEAIAQYEAALRRQPDFAQSHFNLAQALRRSGRLAEAVTHYRRAIELKPDLPEARLTLAQALEQAGRGAEARAEYAAILQQQPDDVPVHLALGLAFARAEQLEEARVQFEAAVRLDGSNFTARCNLGNVLNLQSNYVAAVEHYATAVQLQPANPGVRANLAGALAKLGRRDEARQQWTEVLRLQPDHAEAKRQLQALVAPETK